MITLPGVVAMLTPDHEIGRVGLTDAQRAVPGLDIFRQHLHAANEVVAVRR